MARASTRKTEQAQPDVSIVTDENADATEEQAAAGQSDAGSEPADDSSAAGDDGQKDSSDEDGTETQDDTSRAVDAGGSVVVKVIADGVTFRVGGHPLLLLRGALAKVNAEVADRGERRETLRRV